MKIGLVDTELTVLHKERTLNVELMKLGTYYQSIGHEVEALTEKSNPYDYDKLVIFATSCAPLKRFLHHPNTDFYGEYYHNKIYVPFYEDKIDYGEYSFKIYNSLLKYNFLKKIYKEEDIKMFKDAQWVRLYPNNEPIDVYSILTGEKTRIVDNYFFDKKEWKTIIKNIAIYASRTYFMKPIIIRNSQDLDNFIWMRQFNFGALKGLILISGYENFEKFCLENQVKLQQYSNVLIYNIGYNDNNLYSENFYLLELEQIFKRAELLNKLCIRCVNTEMTLYSGKVLTFEIYHSLLSWFVSHRCTSIAFRPYFIMTHKNNPDVQRFFRNFISAKPEYNKLFIKPIGMEV